MKIKNLIRITALSVALVMALCSCGGNDTPVENEETVVFDASKYILNKELWETPDYASGFHFEIQPLEARTKNKQIMINSIKKHDIGKPSIIYSPAAAEEWGYSFHHLNGAIDGMNRQIDSGFKTAPTSRADALSQIKEFVFRQYRITEGQPWHAMNGFYYYQHYAAEWGCTEVGSEIGIYCGSHQMHTAYTRGAAKQNAIKWYMYYANWGYDGVLDYSGDWDVGGPNNGHSLSFAERMFISTFMQGADHLLVEAAMAQSLYPELGDDGAYKITPYGETCRKAYQFTEKHKDIGTCYTPFVIAMDYYHGTPGGWTNFKGVTDYAFNTFPFNKGDFLREDIMEIFFGDSYNISSSHETLADDPGEPGYVTNNPLSDSVDVVLQNASQAVLNSYPCVILAGDITFNEGEVERYKAYAEQGGCLVMNTVYLKDFPEYQAQYNGEKTHELKVGNGSVIIYGGDYEVDSLKDIVYKKYNEYSPISVDTYVQTIVSLKDDTIYVALINNRGVEQLRDKQGTKIDENESRTVTVGYRHSEPVKSITEVYENKEIKVDGNFATVTLGPGGIAVLKFDFK